MKARSVLVAVCVVLWVASDSNCESARETYKKWAGIVETLRKSAVASDDGVTECSATPEQTLSWVHLKVDLFDEQKKTGILNYAWPRLSFYTEALKPLTEAPSLNDTVVCASATYGQRVCVVNKCKDCTTEYKEIESDATLKEICDGSYAKPPAEVEVTEEMRKELAAILKPPVESPGELTAEEAIGWMKAKLSEKKNKVAEKEGDECDAPPQLTMSLSYLRMMYKTGADTGKKTEKELGSHPEFYAEKLKWLKGADKEIVPCDGGIVCGWDGVCVKCEDKVADPENLGLTEACALKWIDVWEREYVPTPTKYGDHLEAYGSWVAAFLKVRKSSVKKDAVEMDDEDNDPEKKNCSASVEQTISYSYLTNLLYKHQKSGVMFQAWPRISFYEGKFGEVEKAAEDIIFCASVYGSNDGGFLCLKGTCKTCKEMERDGYGNELYRQRCSGKLENPPAEYNLPRQKEVEEMRRIDVEMKEPKGVLTLEEVLDWNGTLAKTAILRTKEPCDTPPQLTLSEKTLLVRLMRVWPRRAKKWRWRTQEEVRAEMEAHRTAFEKQLRWLKGVEKTRAFCGPRRVCVFEGVCAHCSVAEVMEVQVNDPNAWDDLRKACELKVAKGKKDVSRGGRVGGGGKWGAAMVFASVFCVSFL